MCPSGSVARLRLTRLPPTEIGAVELATSDVEANLGGLEVGVRLLELLIEDAGVDLRDEVTGLQEVTHLDGHFQNLSGGLGPDLDRKGLYPHPLDFEDNTGGAVAHESGKPLFPGEPVYKRSGRSIMP